MSDWYEFENAEETPSPALLLYPERIRENVRRMIRMAGDAKRLRPHIKTHKLAEVVRIQLEEGIAKFKCATIAEAELAAAAAAKDILIAYQMVGPNILRLLELTDKFPEVRFSSVVDDEQAIEQLNKVFGDAPRPLEVLLDIDCGQHRTGVEPGSKALKLYQAVATARGLKADGLHVYDGHIHEGDLSRREALCKEAFVPVNRFREELLAAGLAVPRVVTSGTPTFPLHARSGFECSPGTCVLWDFGYSDKFADLDFLQAAVLLTRVVSKPGKERLCVDLGHKAVAAENPHPRVRFLNLPDATAVSHSEEHLVVESPNAAKFEVGDVLYGVPRHICPTVALYAEAFVVSDGRARGTWRVAARDRKISI
jgi:D-serine deaminase-like pyridoxal phosphate-dependent protein